MDPIRTSRTLSRSATGLSFDDPVAHVYNPLAYARAAHEAYLSRYCRSGIDAILLGMNPGPWGMAQTGVPFGDVTMVREWLGIGEGVKKPRKEHPKRPILGFDCKRNEVSGTRLWGWARDRFGEADSFFDHFFVWNYCPLAFMEESGRNRTPDKLAAEERAALFDICNRALTRIADFTQPHRIIGIGKFAELRARSVFGNELPISSILHPSPASPAANRGWSQKIEQQLTDLGIRLP